MAEILPLKQGAAPTQTTQMVSGSDTVANALLGSGSDASGANVLLDNHTWKPNAYMYFAAQKWC
jgi:hypothetical protein